ncbi:hypothetical protein IEQ34_000785 [Dendrobium chrysotoxum]|uniref:Uncharacterized protein n=1 Tax=Dendrobium chrysotoxum TaxID=161865 RepID=A0AAV7HTY7_DENCH|nr:hypothetical protein IEQ34_000785 [Dendrobium chrysotoxum]
MPLKNFINRTSFHLERGSKPREKKEESFSRLAPLRPPPEFCGTTAGVSPDHRWRPSPSPDHCRRPSPSLHHRWSLAGPPQEALTFVGPLPEALTFTAPPPESHRRPSP